MRTRGSIIKVRETLYSEIVNDFKTLTEVRADVVKTLNNGVKISSAVALVDGLLTDVGNMVSAAHFDGARLPEYIVKSTINVDDNGNAESVNIVLRTKLKSAYKYKSDCTVSLKDADFINKVGNFYLTTLFVIFNHNEAMANVTELNDRLAEIISANEIPFSLSFDIVDDDATVLRITDSEVVFNIPVDAAFDISNLGIFQTGDNFSEFINKRSVEQLSSALKAIPNTPSLIKSHLDIVKTLTRVSTKKRASKLIRESYHRNAKYLDRVKTGIGYFDETVGDVHVFALVEKAEDGSLSVILAPFDVTTNLNVDVDVIAELNK